MFDLVRPDTLAPTLPSLYAPDAAARRRTVEFFTAHIRNANTHKAYAQAGADFSRWCGRHGIPDVRSVEAVHIAAYVKQLSLAPQTVKQQLAGADMPAGTREMSFGGAEGGPIRAIGSIGPLGSHVEELRLPVVRVALARERLVQPCGQGGPHLVAQASVDRTEVGCVAGHQLHAVQAPQMSVNEQRLSLG